MENLINNAPELWAAIGVIFGTVVVALAGIAVTALAGTKALVYGKLLWAEIRGKRAEIIGAIDDPTDKVITELNAVTGIPVVPLSDALEAALRVVLDYRDKPPQETVK